MKRIWMMVVAVLVGAVAARAEVKMPAIFGDHMVLQGGKTLPVWGTASPGESITVTLGKRHAKCKADEKGDWRVDLKAIKPGSTALTMVVKGTNELTFTDVLVGDVWVGSGQSNMQFDIKGANTFRQAMTTADRPMIRLFTVSRLTAAYPQTDINPEPGPLVGKWLVCTPENLSGSNFSAVAYFFGVRVQEFTGKPVGLIHASWGGTPAESWVSYDGLKKDVELKSFVDRHALLLQGYDEALAGLPKRMTDWEEKDADWKLNVKPVNDATLAEWQAKVSAAKAAGEAIPPRPQLVSEPSRPDISGGAGQPSSLYNGMIAPVVPYAIKGVIWYQGEANAVRGMQYRVLLPALIKDWRTHWNGGDFPFLFVQLPDYDSKWGLLREAQTRTLSLPNTGMAITIDVGTLKNIHPPFKEIVGDRLALVAEHVAYGKKLVYTGPMYKAMKVEDGAARISFDDVGSGLTILPRPVRGPDVVPAPTDHLEGFSIAGDDKVWHPAQAKIDGKDVIVSSADVSHPVAVRYGWDPPPVCNLYNNEGLPASPFRTDDWE